MDRTSADSTGMSTTPHLCQRPTLGNRHPDRWTLLDVETTGFSRRDHIIEIAALTITSTGEVVNNWSSLIRPPGKLDPGPTHVHGITADQLTNAPTWKAVTPYLARVLSGSIVVAHNLPFEERFLATAFAQAGSPIPAGRLRGLCTQQATRTLNFDGQSLDHLCEETGVTLQHAHTALGDTWALAEALPQLLPNLTHQAWEPQTAWDHHHDTWADHAPPQVRRVSLHPNGVIQDHPVLTRENAATGMQTHQVIELADQSSDALF
jgi:DNA polymerase III epsilon subunit family exonuclease